MEPSSRELTPSGIVVFKWAEKTYSLIRVPGRPVLLEDEIFGEALALGLGPARPDEGK